MSPIRRTQIMMATGVLFLCLTRTAAQQAGTTKPPTDADILYQQGVALERNGKAADAVRIYRRAAREGNEKAARRLGEIFDKGAPGVTRDYDESLAWYKRAQELTPGGAVTTPGGTPLIGDFSRPGRK